MPMTDESTLDDLLDRWEARVREGRPIELESLCGEHPKLLDELRRRVAMLGRMDALLETQAYSAAGAEGPREPTTTATGASEISPAAIDAGRYRAIRFHAAGGLGAIFVAHDSELQREVALKLIKHEWASSAESRHRFALEAEITGRLEHPGIVPVYGFGHGSQSGEGGRPFYTMRFIRGESLQSAIDRFHAADAAPRDPGERALEFQKLLRGFLLVCETIAFAHSRGVVHRDLKPANIMLGAYGETLVVDWGLAKVLGATEPAAPDDDTLWTPAAAARLEQSIQGLARGSPAYMSPEQAEGRWDLVGPVSDIYSLGAVLYMLLTGQRAFDGRDLGEVFDKVRRGDFRPPRAVKASVPEALEAVCLKAMRVAPSDRYQSAQLFAADIEHYLADEPVSALVDRWPTRARRWLKRHRTFAASAGIGLLMTLLGLAGLSAVLRVKNTQLTTARQRAEQNFDLAHGAVKDLLDEVDGNPALRRPGTHRAQESLLRVALKYYRDFLSSGHDDPQLRREQAQAHRLVGQIVAEIGPPEQALTEYRAAEAILAKLAASGATPEIAFARADIASRLALLEGQLGRLEASRADFRQARERYERLVADHPRRAEFRWNLACLQLAEGEFTQDATLLEAARKAFDETPGGATALPAEMQLALARTCCALGAIYNLRGELTAAGTALRAPTTRSPRSVPRIKPGSRSSRLAGKSIWIRRRSRGSAARTSRRSNCSWPPKRGSPASPNKIPMCRNFACVWPRRILA